MKTIFAISLLIASSAFATDGDVYNFYFQKAPGPQTVIQSGAKRDNSDQLRETPNGVEAIPSTKTGEPTTSLKAPPPAIESKKPEEPDYKKWSVRFGSEVRTVDLPPDDIDGRNNYVVGSGSSVGGTYAFNKFLALDASILFAKAKTLSGASLRPSADAIIPYFGLELTPIRVALFNYNLMDFAFIAGVTAKGLDSSGAASHYTGIRFSLNFSSNFAFQTIARFTPESEIGEGGAHFAWRF